MKDKTVYTCTYKSKLGDILLAADAIGLTGLWFEGQKYFANTLPDGEADADDQDAAGDEQFAAGGAERADSAYPND